MHAHAAMVVVHAYMLLCGAPCKLLERQAAPEQSARHDEQRDGELVHHARRQIPREVGQVPPPAVLPRKPQPSAGLCQSQC